ncbi:MAG: o-succinylbenzoate synthase [Cyanobacteria bacterium J06597_1]
MTNSRPPAVRSCRLDIRTFRRPFVRPLVTSHGEWLVREGAIVRLSAQGRVGYGELAPIPWFGSESLAEALNCCASLEDCLTAERLAAIPDRFPATQFALESAWVDLGLPESEPTSAASPSLHSDWPVCGLLPTGEAALQEWSSLLERGYTTLKWKIGVEERATELAWFYQLAEALPSNVVLRLDANGGLDMAGAIDWLQACDRLSIEYLEQPLPPTEFDALLRLQSEFATPIALDESVATLRDLQRCIARGWNGLVVVKPAICGFPSRAQQFCKTHHLDVVVSSALETPVGQHAALTFAREIGSHRALGFGVDHLLQPVLSNWPAGLWQTSTPS